MNRAQQPIVKRYAASPYPNFGGLAGGGGMPLSPGMGGFNPMSSNPLAGMLPTKPSNPIDDMNALYPPSVGAAMRQAQIARVGGDPRKRPMLPKEATALAEDMRDNPGQPPPVRLNSIGEYEPVFTQFKPRTAVQPAAQPVAPVPMTAEELDAYNRRARKASTHPLLKRAVVCLNCEFFYAYTRGTDKQYLTLCKYDGKSPWDKNFTCGTSKCDNYAEIGTDAVKVEPPPTEKKKRSRRSRAEIEAAKAAVAKEADSKSAKPAEKSEEITELEALFNQETPLKQSGGQ